MSQLNRGLSLCYSNIQLAPWTLIKTSCCVHSLLHLSCGTLKLLQLFSHGQSVVEDGLLYTCAAVSAARALLDWHLQFSEANDREKIKHIDWFNCQLTTHLWFCGGVFSFFMCSSPQGGLSPGPLELVRIQFLFQRKHSSNLA